MRRANAAAPATLAVLLLIEGAAAAQVPPTKTRPPSGPVRTGESVEFPSALGAKLRADLASANAAAQAALARLKAAPPPSQPRDLKVAAAAAGLAQATCDRAVYRIEDSASGFQVQPGQFVTINGCFRGSPALEVRLEGGSLPGGALLLGISQRGDTFLYGQVPDVAGVPDQPVAIVVHFLADGFRTPARTGQFHAKRQTWDTYVDDAVCPSLRANDRAPIVNVSGDGPLCAAAGHPSPGGVDRWASRARDQGYRITKFWWKAYTDALPGTVQATDDGGITVAVPPGTWYGAYRFRVEGPAGLRPF